MTLPTTILVPTDFSDPAAAALDYAISLATKLGARIVLLNAIRIPVLGMVDMGAVVTEGAMDSVVQASEGELKKLASRSPSQAIETMVRTGDARDVILEVASELAADLIVMGTHGHRGFRRLLLGSVAEAIVRAAPCPVLTLHTAAAAAA